MLPFAGAKSCPLFIKITKDNLEGKDILRALALAVNGVTPMKTNPNFNDQVVKVMHRIDGALDVSLKCPSIPRSRSL